MNECYKIDKRIIKWNQESKTEEEIIKRLIYELKSKDLDPDLLHEYNEALRWNGISYRFNENVGEINDIYDEGYESCHDLLINVKKSKEKTRSLLVYLYYLNDRRISFSNLSFIKVEHLISLNCLDSNLVYKYKNYSLYDLYMMSLSPKYDGFFNGSRDDIKNNIEEFIPSIGITNLYYLEHQFKSDMEYLLWTITKTLKSKDAFKKINTIKVGLQIVPRELFIWGDIKYYNENVHKNLVKYLSYIDKAEAKRMYDKYKDQTNNLHDTGYKLLFNML